MALALPIKDGEEPVLKTTGGAVSFELEEEAMAVYIVSYRDEFCPDLLELAAFDKREKANAVVESLVLKRQELSKAELQEDEMNRQWHTFMRKQGISENKFFVLNVASHNDYSFNVRELEVLS